MGYNYDEFYRSLLKESTSFNALTFILNDFDENDSNLIYYQDAYLFNTTEYKKDTVGGLMDRSAELSDKRAKEAGGIDPVKQKYFEDYSKNRRGFKHPSDPSRYEKLTKMGLLI